MAYWLSFWRMTRSWQRFFGRASAGLWLFLAASLAYAGAACVSAVGPEAPALRAAAQDRCPSASAAPDACVVNAQRTDFRVTAGALSSPEPQPAAGRAEHAARIFRAVAEPQPPVGFAPASPVPVYILLRRYLS